MFEGNLIKTGLASARWYVHIVYIVNGYRQLASLTAIALLKAEFLVLS